MVSHMILPQSPCSVSLGSESTAPLNVSRRPDKIHEKSTASAHEYVERGVDLGLDVGGRGIAQVQGLAGLDVKEHRGLEGRTGRA